MGRPPFSYDNKDRKPRQVISEELKELVKTDYPYATLEELQQKFHLSRSSIKNIANSLEMKKVNVIRKIEITHPDCEGVFLFFVEDFSKFIISCGNSKDIFSSHNNPPYLFLMSTNIEDYNKYIQGLPTDIIIENNLEKKYIIYKTDRQIRERFSKYHF